MAGSVPHVRRRWRRDSDRRMSADSNCSLYREAGPGQVDERSSSARSEDNEEESWISSSPRASCEWFLSSCGSIRDLKWRISNCQSPDTTRPDVHLRQFDGHSFLSH